jgi:hypothetical protein
MARSWFERPLKKSRPLSRSVQRHMSTLEALEERTVLSFLPPATFPVGVNPRAVAVADFNNDGKPDLAVVNGGQASAFPGSLSVLLGNGDGSFQPAVTTNIVNAGPGQGNALSLAVGDFNGDHLPDVAVTTSGSTGNSAVEVLLSRGDGAFQPNHQVLSVGQIPLSVAVGDFDRNGALDLVTANSQGTLSLLLGNGDGTFKPRVDLAVGAAPRAVAVGDFNGDGLLDVVAAQQLSNTVTELLGHGDGTFNRPLVFAASSGLEFAPSSLAVGDVNGDGRADLVINSVGGEDSTVSQIGVLLGNGKGAFGSPIFNSPQGGEDGDVVLGDFNNDGRLDVAVGGEAALPDGLAVFNGNGDGTFQQFLEQRFSTGGIDPFGVAAADLNGDGRVDLVAANAFTNPTGGPSTVGVLLNTSGPVTAAATTTTLNTSTATAVIGQIETLTATVSSQAGTPIGSVIFRDGATVLGFVPLDAAGQATVPVSLGIGTHALTASFSGSIGFADSDSAATAVTVNPAATTVALGSSVNPAGTGQAVTFTANVAAVAPGGGTPTGTVTFKDGNVVLGTVAVGTRGTATFTTSFAATGSHVITAVYSGDPIFLASSQVLTEQVNATPTHKATTTALLASANPVVVGRAVTFTANVRDPSGTGTPTGTVTFYVGNTVLARVALNASGQARLTAVFGRAGQFTIRAVYSGDASFDASSQSLIEQVNR